MKQAEYKEMRDVFDRPTPYTLNSLYSKGATKTNLEAVVWLKYDTSKGTPADKYLLPQIRGGQRSLKRFELALRSVGALPSGYFAVPGSAADLDAYGNMKSSQIVQILSYFRAFPEAGYRANITEKRKQKLNRQGIAYFVGSPGGGKSPLGIWKRVGLARGSSIKPIIIFVKSVHYAVRFDFDYVGQQTVRLEFSGQFAQAMAEANASAR
ncbi:MAG: hypothetical protein ACRENK_15695 [Gemmatimonadaceae bacterium]